MDRISELPCADDATVVLIGSTARGRRTWRSDIDILFITPKPMRRWTTSPELHLHMETRRGFVRKLESGDDFAAWAIRFGKVLSDKAGWWAEVSSMPAARNWPDSSKKWHLAARRLRMAIELIDMDDLDAAEEELLTSASHVARAVLLERHVFPLSRPEISSQLRELTTDPRLARNLDVMIEGGLDRRALKAIAEQLDARLDEHENG